MAKEEFMVNEERSLQPLTFGALLSKTLSIPTFQRDYAQGRDNKRAESVRKQFVASLYEVACGPKSAKLSLDLISTQPTQDGYAVIDGQQRLTTLFLFFLYHGGKANLRNFRYVGREDAKTFCDEMCAKWEAIKKKLDDQEDAVTRSVTDQIWFHLAWLRDATIMGMLCVLDEIHANRRKLTPGWEERFTFYRLDDDGQVTRYMLMNARGKTLTDFENLKAHLESKKQLSEEGWCKPIDGEWLQVLWDACEDKTGATSACNSALQRLTLSLLLLNYAKHVQTQSEEGEQRESGERLLASLHDMAEGNGINYIEVDKALQDAWANNLMAWMARIFKWQDAKKRMTMAWASNAWSPFNELTYKELVLLYTYVSSESKDDDDDWFAIVHNVIENVGSPIDRPSRLLRAMQWVDVALTNIDEALQDKKFTKQVDEECLKCERIVDKSEWREYIRKAEKLPWLKGRIAFLLEGVQTPDELKDNLKDCQKIVSERDKWLLHILWHLAEESEKGQDGTPWYVLPCELTDDQLKAFIYSDTTETLQKNLLQWTKEEKMLQGSLWEKHVAKITDWRHRKLHRGDYGNDCVWLYKNATIRNALRIDSAVNWWFEVIDVINAAQREFAFGGNGTIQIWVANSTRSRGGDWCPNGDMEYNGQKELKLDDPTPEAVRGVMKSLIKYKWKMLRKKRQEQE